MKEKLIIKNFGPIKDVELDLGRFNILIGEQATGKSTVAKVLAVCRYFSYIVDERGTFPPDHLNSTFAEGLFSWGLSEYIYKNSFIYYSGKHYSVTVESQKITQSPFTDNAKEFFILKPAIEARSLEFKNLLLELDNIKPKENDSLKAISFNWRVPTSFFLNDVKSVLENPFYLPTQRGLQSIFSIGQASIQNLSDSLFSQFARLDQIARFFKKETYIEPLDIYYVNRDGHGFIRKANETEYYSLYNAASGYQSMIPIVLVVKYYTELRKKSKSLFIEEPELDVFPTAQDKLIQYLSEKTKVYDSTVVLTTHSPYTLTSLNNLMYAYQVGQVHPEKVSKEIEKKYWLNPDDVSAYMMKTDGSLENIIDDEGLIKAEKIDEVSNAINLKFNNIMNIELGIDEESK